MKTFCTQRGCEIEYQGQRPKFCPHCGSSMVGSNASQSPPPQQYQPRPQRYQPPQNWEDEVEAEDFDLTPGSISINLATSAPQPIKAESIVGTGSTGFGARRKVPQTDYKKFEKRMHENNPSPIEV